MIYSDADLRSLDMNLDFIQEFLKSILTPLSLLRERMVVAQRKIKRREDSLKETQSWVWQKGVIPHEKKDVTKDSFVLSDWRSSHQEEEETISPGCRASRYNLLCRLRVFIDRFMLIALSIWCLLFLFSF